MLYSFKGVYPAPLPFQIFLEDGRCRTDPQTFTPEELTGAGFTGPFEMPEQTAGTKIVWTGEAFEVVQLTPEELALQEQANKPPVPPVVTNYQARAALLQAGLFEQVNNTLLALPITDPARQAWEYANEVTRHGSLVNGVTGQLGMTPAQVDELFRVAATIEA